MDSDNSGSIQSSSSGGDEQEYDSRATESSISALFNSPGAVGAFDNAPLLQLYSLNTRSNSYLNNQQLLQQQHDQQQGTSSFHPLEGNNNNLLVNQNHNNNNNNMSNQDMVWAHKIDMNPSCTQPGPVGYLMSNHTTTSVSTPQQASPLLSGPVSGASVATNQDHQQQHPTPVGQGPGPVRNPKKRSRASRRAPTTVLTTDTTNFRQMVQEFTGIPAPPFSASGFPTSRSTRLDLDLFGGVGMGMGMGMGMCMGKGMGMGMGLGLLSRGNSTTASSSIDVTSSSSSPGIAQQHPRYLLRPFPQKILPHPHHPIPQQHKLNSISTPTPTPTTTTNSTSSLFDATLTTNSILPFQPLLQTPSSSSPLLPLIHHDSGQVNIVSKTGLSSSPMDQFGLTRIATTSTTMQILKGGGDGGFRPGSGPNPRGSGSNTVIANDKSSSNWVSRDQLPQQGFDHRQDGGDVSNSQQNSAMNATLEDRGGGVRGEGMVDSWICSSD